MFSNKYVVEFPVQHEPQARRGLGERLVRNAILADVSVLAQLPMPRLRPRSLWRNTGPLSREEVRRTERWLATARVFLAISALVAVWIDPAEIRSAWAYALLDFYIAQGTLIIFLLRSQEESTPLFRLFVHAGDIVWPGLISLFTAGQNNPFFLFFVFVIAAAAYRWGAWETVMTAVGSISLLWLEGIALQFNLLPIANADIADFEPRRLLMRSVYLLVMGFLLGYLAEQQKRLRAEKDEAARMLGMVRMDAGLAGTLSQIVGELLRLYSAPRALISSHESRNPKISVGKVELRKGAADLQWIEAGPSGAATYLQDAAVASCYAESVAGNHGQRFAVLGLDSEGKIYQGSEPSFLRMFAEVHPFHHLFAISFSLGPELWGRIFLLEPQLISAAEDELRFLQDLVRQVGPAVYNVYLLRRLRRRAGALERGRLVRELHDGAVQSLIGVEMQVDVLRRQHPVPQPLSDELARVQQLLREEVLKLRELMLEMNSTDVDARRLPGFLRDTVQRFQRETGINARFLMDDEELLLPQSVCRELARITQEALVNVRKHSGAKQVSVQLLEAQGRWELVVEDDGAGFPFTGRVSQSELDASGRAPTVIRERVRLIQGELTIESRPGRGARVEVRVPETQQAAHG